MYIDDHAGAADLGSWVKGLKMKNKDYSKWLKFALVLIAFTLCVLKWLLLIVSTAVVYASYLFKTGMVQIKTDKVQI